MSSATYFATAEYPGLWVTHEPMLRRLLRRHGWHRIPYAEAMKRLGGNASAKAAIARCPSGYIEITSRGPYCDRCLEGAEPSEDC